MGFAAEGREYPKWDVASVGNRAQRFFRNGGPFTSALREKQTLLQEAQTIRNAVAHDSENAREKFQKLVREKLKTLPPNLAVGGFLNTVVPGSNPPLSFLEFYLTEIDFTAEQIVPSR